MKKNGYLERRRIENDVYIHETEKITRQMMCDTLAITLNQELGFGYDRAKRLVLAWSDNYNKFMTACDTKHPEADYMQEVLDRELRYICRGHEFFDFKQRYPMIRDIKYSK